MSTTAPITTRTRLLREARGLFARHGYEGASVRAITAEAGANLGAVTYHFGSKQGLYEAVLDMLLGPLEEKLAVAAEGPGSALDRIERAVAAVVEHLHAHPDQVAIIQHELALQRPLPERVRRWIVFLYGTLTRLIREGQAEDTLIAGPPGLLAASAVAQPFYFAVIGTHIAEAGLLGGFIPPSPADVADHVRHTIHRTLAVERDRP
jgi:AcrR family transcriptional regulator